MWNRVVCCLVIEHLLTHIKEQEKKNLKINLVEKLEEKVATRSLSNMREYEKKTSRSGVSKVTQQIKAPVT